MLQALRNKQREDGFTLIELMVVVLIIAILIAIAVPTFLGARERAQDKAAQSDLRNALTAAKVLYTDNQSYDQTAANLAAVEPSLSFSDTVGNASTSVVGIVGAADEILFVRVSDTADTVFAIYENEATGTNSCSGANIAAVDTVAECDALDNSWL